MGVNDRVLAIELDGRLAACDHAVEDIALAIPIDVAFVLLNLDELGLALKVVEHVHAEEFGEVQAGSHLDKV